MTGADVRGQLDRLGLSQREAARLLGIHEATFHRYVRDSVRPSATALPPPVARLLDICEHVPGALDRLRAHSLISS